MDEQQLLAFPYKLEWRGKILKFGGIVQDVQAECVAAAKLNAIEQSEEYIRIKFTDDDIETVSERRAYQKRFEDTIVSGDYLWNGEAETKYRKSPKGASVFIGALLNAGGNPLTTDELEELYADKPEEIGAIMILAQWDISHPKQARPPKLMAMVSRLLRSKKSMPSSPANPSTTDLGKSGDSQIDKSPI